MTATMNIMKKDQKSVRFAPSAKMRLTLHVNQYTAEELDASYYKCDDFRSFKMDVKRTARMMEMKQKLDESVHCTRGVEHRTMQGAKIKSKLRRKAMNVVYKEQMKQFFDEEENHEQSFENAEKLASVYSEAVRSSVVSAYMTGLSDEMIANEFVEKEDIDPNVGNRHGPSVTKTLSGFKRIDKAFPIRKKIYNSAA